MQFNSWSDFFAMGGYGFYVWLSFGVALIAMVGIVLQSAFVHTQLIKQIATEQQRQRRIQRARQAKKDTARVSSDRTF